MNDDTSRSQRRGLPHSVGILAAATGIALITAACSGNPSAGGSGGSSPTASSSPSTGGSGNTSPAARSTTQQNQNAFLQCMRSHGVDMPNLSAPSGQPSGAPSGAPNDAHKLSGPNPNSPQYKAAMQACASLAGTVAG